MLRAFILPGITCIGFIVGIYIGIPLLILITCVCLFLTGLYISSMRDAMLVDPRGGIVGFYTHAFLLGAWMGCIFSMREVWAAGNALHYLIR